MPNTIDRILAGIRDLQEQLETELTKRREAFRYRLENGRVVFDKDVRKHHRAMRVKLATFLAATRPVVVLTAPLIYGLILPFALLDLFVSVYQAVCFRAYKIARVRRREYIAIDRQHLAYLNGLQKLNCIYCGYCNGIIAYVREIGARTEAYWCPIKHARHLEGEHGHYQGFSEFGDAVAFDPVQAQLRKDLAGSQTPPPEK